MQASFEFVHLAIETDLLASVVVECNKETSAGGLGIFIGQVRADVLHEQEVVGIDYSAYEDMAIQQAQQIMQEAIEEFELKSIYIIHSLGLVKTGEMCLLVCTVSKHRKQALDACQKLVERIKKELPIWGKELFENNNSTWKVNT